SSPPARRSAAASSWASSPTATSPPPSPPRSPSTWATSKAARSLKSSAERSALDRLADFDGDDDVELAGLDRGGRVGADGHRAHRDRLGDCALADREHRAEPDSGGGGELAGLGQ